MCARETETEGERARGHIAVLSSDVVIPNCMCQQLCPSRPVQVSAPRAPRVRMVMLAQGDRDRVWKADVHIRIPLTTFAIIIDTGTARRDAAARCCDSTCVVI